MIKCDNLYGKFKCTRILKTFFTDHSLPTCTFYFQSFRVSLPKPKHGQSFLVVGFVKGKYVVQYYEAYSHERDMTMCLFHPGFRVMDGLLNRKYFEIFVGQTGKLSV